MKNCVRKYLGVICSFVVVMIALRFFSANVFSAEDAMNTSDSVLLTAKEQAYLQAHPTIVVAADASWRPLEYQKENEYTGVIAKILGRLEDATGFKIEYKVMDSYAEALEAVRCGQADFISGIAADQTMAEEYHVNLSKPYLDINSAVVSKQEVRSLYDGKKHKKIAVVEGDYANREIEKRILNSELVLCASNEECLEKVRKEEVDMAIIASYCAEYYRSIPKYSGFESHTIADFTWKLSFGVSTKSDPEIISILNKGIDQMSEIDLNESVYKGILEAQYDNDLMVFIYKHPILVIGVVLTIVFLIGFLVFIILLTKKREHIRQLEDGVRLRLALERTRLCIWEIDLLTKSVHQIDNEQEKHGFYELRENIPESVIEKGYIHPEDIELVRDVLNRVKNGEQNVQGCWRIKEKMTNGEDTIYWWEQVLFHVVFDERNRPVKVIGVSEDVTKEKEAQKDSLTLVYNRHSFEQKASLVLNERRNAYLECAFLILDLDGFKQINDTYGHGMGDRVLISVGATMKKTFRSTDLVGRLGGDEFTVFMTSISKKEDAERKAEELVVNISKIQKKEEYPFAVSCSVGAVVATKGQEDFATLYKKADTALYEAKRAGKNQYRLYE